MSEYSCWLWVFEDVAESEAAAAGAAPGADATFLPLGTCEAPSAEKAAVVAIAGLGTLTSAVSGRHCEPPPPWSVCVVADGGERTFPLRDYTVKAFTAVLEEVFVDGSGVEAFKQMAEYLTVAALMVTLACRSVPTSDPETH